MITKRIDKAREAFKKGNIAEAKRIHEHTHENHKEEGNYIKSMIYGGLDGIITTFAVVAGVAGAALSPNVVIILGFANLIADGISMAFGDYLSTKAEQEYFASERKREEWEVEHHPEGEKAEMIDIYQKKGFSKTDSKKLIDILSKNKKAWVDAMMVDELGILEDDSSPIHHALITFGSFALFGFIPLLAYVLGRIVPSVEPFMFQIAIVLTGITLFALGATKTKFIDRSWWKSGFEMLLVGGIAAVAAYGIGALLSGLA